MLCLRDLSPEEAIKQEHMPLKKLIDIKNYGIEEYGKTEFIIVDNTNNRSWNIIYIQKINELKKAESKCKNNTVIVILENGDIMRLQQYIDSDLDIFFSKELLARSGEKNITLPI